MRSKHGLKGMPFKSYGNTTPAPPRQQWVAHTGKRRALKNLEAKCRTIIDSKDPETIAVGLRAMQMVKDEPDPRYSFLHLVAAAIDASSDTGETWVVAMTYFCDKFDQNQEDSPPAERIEDDGRAQSSN